mmetsp:Transcript_11698/g.20352  ORF Transcript_11698/g.20352 Transcript_11698/m.20352 type:complete len:81 (-) Transcript_11698:634-876(-)
MLIEKAEFTSVDLKSTCFGSTDDIEVAATLMHLDAMELVTRPEPLVAMFYGSFSAPPNLDRLAEMLEVDLLRKHRRHRKY